MKEDNVFFSFFLLILIVSSLTFLYFDSHMAIDMLFYCVAIVLLVFGACISLLMLILSIAGRNKTEKVEKEEKEEK